MRRADRFDGGPRSAIVVGAGIVGLSTAWFLQERGVEVTVVDRTGIAGGASAGNAGWIAPSLALPLNRPAAVLAGVQSLFDLKTTADPALAAFLLRFAANCRDSSWRNSIAAAAPLNAEAIEAVDVLVDNGVNVPVTDGSITALFRFDKDAKRLLDDVGRLQDIAGADVLVTALAGPALRERVPLASQDIVAGLTIHNQRFVDPHGFVRALGRAVIARGAAIRIFTVSDVLATRYDGIAVRSRQGEELTADVAVIATGAWLPRLARRRLRVPVQAGRGYSFTVPVELPIPEPIYLPNIRVACTPLHGRLRVAGELEFRAPDAPLDAERIERIVAAARPYLSGVRWDERGDEWVGSRPLTPDSRPLVGEVAQDIFVAGGHGMWGLTQGPATGRMLAELITTGKQSKALQALDPRR
jgi:D-amino-acid dehydrogenase